LLLIFTVHSFQVGRGKLFFLIPKFGLFRNPLPGKNV